MENLECLSSILIHWEQEASKIAGIPIKLVAFHNHEMNDKATIMCIKEIVSAKTGIPVKLIESKSRKGDVVDARNICIRLIREMLPKMKYKYIGQQFGRDRTTMLNSLQKFSDLYDTDKEFAHLATECTNEVFSSLIHYKKQFNPHLNA
jgi:chromosomal replication initiation ATPase DnaA